MSKTKSIYIASSLRAERGNPGTHLNHFVIAYNGVFMVVIIPLLLKNSTKWFETPRLPRCARNDETSSILLFIINNQEAMMSKTKSIYIASSLRAERGNPGTHLNHFVIAYNGVFMVVIIPLLIKIAQSGLKRLDCRAALAMTKSPVSYSSLLIIRRQ